MFSQFMRKSARDIVQARHPHHGTRGRSSRPRARARVRWLFQLAASRRPPAYPMLALGAFTLLLGSCLNPPLEPQPLTVIFTASLENATVGQDIRFRYESRGTNLAETVVEYGNGDSESVPFIYNSGAPVNIHSQAGHFDYAYDEPGTYVARATVSTVAGDSQSAQVTVQISGS